MCTFPAFRSAKRSFEPGVLRRNGTERRNERSNAQLSNFYEFENQPALESSKRRAVINAAHNRCCAREGVASMMPSGRTQLQGAGVHQRRSLSSLISHLCVAARITPPNPHGRIVCGLTHGQLCVISPFWSGHNIKVGNFER